MSTNDPLDHPDPARVADAAAMEVLLRCYVRETGTAVPTDGGPLRLELPQCGLRLEVPVRYRSATSWHRFGPPRLASGAAADAALVASALIRETIAGTGRPPHLGADAVARVLDSARRVTAHVAARRIAPDDPAGTPPFLAAEQDLLLGHPFHPTPKSREGASDAELAAYSPELRGSFPLHWFAADRTVVAGDSAGEDFPTLLARLAPPLPLPPGTVPVPAHPWQARDVLGRPGIQELLAAGLLHDLHPAGPPWYPTSSVRTVYRPDAPAMLKLSLGLRITNSRRNNLRSELELGVRVARLLDAGLGTALRRAYPHFAIVRDAAWVSVEAPGAGPESGLETAIRDNPFAPTDWVACLSGLLAERPGLGPSRLGRLLYALTARGGWGVGEVTVEWFGRYLEAVAMPLLWLDAEYGLALEAHQQNTLVRLDDDGWPVGGAYRDSQGYYVRASRADSVRDLLPGFDEGIPVVFDDSLVDERVIYYLAINNLFGIVGALGAQGLADEETLLARLRDVLRRLHRAYPSPLLATLLDAPALPTKGNYLTCVDGRDELVGEVAAQSVYLKLPNPLVEVS